MRSLLVFVKCVLTFTFYSSIHTHCPLPTRRLKIEDSCLESRWGSGAICTARTFPAAAAIDAETLLALAPPPVAKCGKRDPPPRSQFFRFFSFSGDKHWVGTGDVGPLWLWIVEFGIKRQFDSLNLIGTFFLPIFNSSKFLVNIF